MKVAAIYNCWADGLDLLPYSVDNILPVVDAVIIVWAEISNTGKYKEFIFDPPYDPNGKIKLYQCEGNEVTKRNFGIDKAKQLGFTHFLLMDSDEFYIQSEAEQEKKRIEENNLNGTVCRLNVLFKKPTFFLPDHTLVPFIHKLSQNTQAGDFKHYPFVYDSNGNAHIDPTRRINYFDRIEMSSIFMWHASWLRSDYNLKIENSAACNNLKRSTIYSDLEKAAPGVYNDFYRAEIKECENIFNLPEL